MINACKCFCWSLILLQEEGPLAGLLSEFLPNTQKLFEETHAMTKQETFLGRGPRVESSRVREPRRTALPRDCQGFMLPDCLWPIILSQGFLVTHVSLGQDGFQGGSWEVAGHLVPPFDVSRTLPVAGGLLVPCSFPGPPVGKWLRQTVTVVPASWAQSVFPLKTPRSTKVVTIITMCNSIGTKSLWAFSSFSLSYTLGVFHCFLFILRILCKYSPLYSCLETAKKAIWFPWESLVMRRLHRFLPTDCDIFLECNQISPLWQNIARCLHHLLIIWSIVFVITFLA